MALHELPPEILSIIFKQLDVRSKLCVWNTCTHLRNVLRRPEDARKISFARSRRLRFALEASYFRELAPYVEELDLSWVQLRETAVEALKHMRSLRSLDVTHTGLPLSSAAEVCAACARLTRLHADFVTPFLTPAEADQLKSTCQRSFKNLEFVHFTSKVWNCGIFDVLDDGVKELSVSSAYYCDGLIEDLQVYCLLSEAPQIKMFSVCIDKNVKHRTFINRLLLPYTARIVPMEWEFVVTTPSSIPGFPKIYLSANLHREASRQPGGEVFHFLDPTDRKLDEANKISLFAWHGSLAATNGSLYKNIALEILGRFPRRVCKLGPEPGTSNCYFMSSCTFRETNSTNQIDLNVSSYIKTNDKIKVSYSKMCNCSDAPIHCDVIGTSNLSVLKNIVFLSITGIDLSSDCYETFLVNCIYLETVHIEKNHTNFIRNVHYSRSLKNVRIVDDLGSDLEEVFSRLCECTTLENVHICDTTDLSYSDISEPPVSKDMMLPLFQKCPDLRSLYVSMCNKMKVSVARAQFRVAKVIRRKLDRADLHFGFDIVAKNNFFEDQLNYYEPSRMFFEQFTLTELDVNKRLVY